MCFALRRAFQAVGVMHLQQRWVRLDHYMSRIQPEDCSKESEQQQTLVRRDVVSIDASIRMTALIPFLGGLRYSESATLPMSI